MKLTTEQYKMVIEYFATKAAEEAPVTDLDWKDWDKHMWMTCYQTSLAIERVINIKDWATLINAALDWQQFDRDADKWLFERGEDSLERNRFYYRGVLQDVLSASIDTAYNTSKAA